MVVLKWTKNVSFKVTNIPFLMVCLIKPFEVQRKVSEKSNVQILGVPYLDGYPR